MTQDNADLIAGRYQLVERIGQGGMGRVWRGTDQHLFGREVAVKEILFPPGLGEAERDTLLKRFMSEARAAVTLNHPGIITIHDVVEHHGAPVIVMEFVRGQSLAAAIREQGRLPVRRVAEIGAAMLGALGEAHGAGIVHRDIKPDNVLLTKDRVVLTDFGIAHLADATTRLSHSGIVIGTPQYMPPEQLEGRRPTPANDLWALGATLYHAVEGRPPFDVEGLHALAIAVFTRPHRPPTEAGALGPVLDALLVKEPAQRVGVAGAAELIAAVLAGSSGGSSGGWGGSGGGASGPSPVPRTPTEVAAPSPPPTPPQTAPPAVPPTAPPSTPPSVGAGSGSSGWRPLPYEAAPPGTAPSAPPYVGTPTPPSAPSLPSTPSPWADRTDSYPPVTYRPSEDPAAGRPPRRPSGVRRAAVVGVALATLAVSGVVAWSLTRGDPSGNGGKADGGPLPAPTTSAGAAGGDAVPATTVVIGLDAPLTGSLATLGLGIRNSADLAVKTANRTHRVPGVTFELKALDDQAQTATGQQNATRLVADAKVLGVVGPLNSSVAQSMLTVFDQAGLADVSPANTNPILTQGADWATGAKSRQHPSYFRTVTTDDIQGPFAARYLYTDARKSRLFVIDDGKSYGTGLAAGFSREFGRLGGTVLGSAHVNPDDRDFSQVVATVRSAGPDAVYFGGEYPAGSALSQQLKQAGVTVPLMGGDGLYAPEFIRANSKAEGDLASAVGTPPEELASAKAFLSDYRAAAYPEEAGVNGGYAYDATWAVIEAVRAVVNANGGRLPSDARGKVLQALARVAFDGVTGKVAFDEYGDTTNRQLTVYSVKGGSWSTAKAGLYAP